MEKEGGSSRSSQGFHPSRAAPFLKAHGHLSLCLASLWLEEGNTVLCACTSKSYYCWIKMFEEVHPRVSVFEIIFLKEACRVGLMWQPQMIVTKKMAKGKTLVG